VGDLFDTAPLHFLAHSGFDGIAFLFFPAIPTVRAKADRLPRLEIPFDIQHGVECYD
jgi:hypothetical protein